MKRGDAPLSYRLPASGSDQSRAGEQGGGGLGGFRPADESGSHPWGQLSEPSHVFLASGSVRGMLSYSSLLDAL